MNKLATFVVAVGVALGSPLFAHTMGNKAEGYVSYDGVMDLWIRNKYEQVAEYNIVVYTKDLQPLGEDNAFRTTLEGNTITLEPGEYKDFKIQTKLKGKYYVCSELTKLDGEIPQTATRICLRSWHR